MVPSDSRIAAAGQISLRPSFRALTSSSFMQIFLLPVLLSRVLDQLLVEFWAIRSPL
jgi:hypothetical protein